MIRLDYLANPTRFMRLSAALLPWAAGLTVLLLAAGGALLLGGALVLIEWLVVTDREKIYDVIDQVAAAVEANDLKTASQFVSTSESSMAIPALVKAAMASGSFSKVQVSSDRKIKINRHTSPPTATATARFTAWAQIRDFRTPTQRVTLTLRLEDERWRISKLEYRGVVGKL